MENKMSFNYCKENEQGQWKCDKQCSNCIEHSMKNKPGRPKQLETKKAFSLRLSNDVIDIIRSKPNQVAYIEDLVRKNG